MFSVDLYIYFVFIDFYLIQLSRFFFSTFSCYVTRDIFIELC